MNHKVESPFNLKEFELLEKIGKGSFGVVYKVRDKRKKTIYAAKVTIIPLDEEENPKDIIRNLVREVNIICKLNHPFIIKFVGFSPNDFNGNFRPVLITEYIPNGSLSNLIEQERKGLSNPKYDSTKKLEIILGIASAMSYLHAHDIIHRDLKPDNILIDDNFNIKIADFGLSKINHENKNSMYSASSKGIKGTSIYIPPETYKDWEYTKEGDIYAFAMIVYEMLTTEQPFKDCTYDKFIAQVSKGERPQIDSLIPVAYRNLIERCWSQNASERPSFEKIVSDLINEPDFITEMIDEGEYIRYIEFIEACELKYESERRILNYDEFIGNKKLKKRLDDDSEYIYQQCVKFYNGTGVPIDIKKAAHYCKLAVDKGNIKAMNNYGYMLENGQGFSVNKEEACKYFKMAADKGNVDAMYNDKSYKKIVI